MTKEGDIEMIVHVSGSHPFRTKQFLKAIGVRMDFFADQGYPGIYRVCCEEDFLRLVSKTGKEEDKYGWVLSFNVHGLNKWPRLPTLLLEERDQLIKSWLPVFPPVRDIVKKIMTLLALPPLECMSYIQVIARAKTEEEMMYKKEWEGLLRPLRHEYLLVLSDDLVRGRMVIPVRGFRQDFVNVLMLFEQGILDENLAVHALRALILRLPQDWDGPLVKGIPQHHWTPPSPQPKVRRRRSRSLRQTRVTPKEGSDP